MFNVNMENYSGVVSTIESANDGRLKVDMNGNKRRIIKKHLSRQKTSEGKKVNNN